MSLKNKIDEILNEIKHKWEQLQDVPNVFSYKLEVTQSKTLPGNYNFYSEFNQQRPALRRKPQTVFSMNPEFNESQFNFKKISEAEILMKLKYEKETEISLIINNSPVNMYHTLVCPDVDKGLAQRITLESLRFCADFLLSIENKHYFRIGYNSPGALVSVNHLHLHLMLIEKELYIDQAQIQHLSEPDVYRLDPSMPTEAICYIINNKDTRAQIDQKLIYLYKFLIWLCDNEIPHNIFMTPVLSQKEKDSDPKLKIFIYARENYCEVKELNVLNLGFLEFSGYVSIGDKNLFEKLKEEDVLKKINQETGQVYSKIYKHLKES